MYLARRVDDEYEGTGQRIKGVVGKGLWTDPEIANDAQDGSNPSRSLPGHIEGATRGRGAFGEQKSVFCWRFVAEEKKPEVSTMTGRQAIWCAPRRIDRSRLPVAGRVLLNVRRLKSALSNLQGHGSSNTVRIPF